MTCLSHDVLHIMDFAMCAHRSCYVPTWFFLGGKPCDTYFVSIKVGEVNSVSFLNWTLIFGS